MSIREPDIESPPEVEDIYPLTAAQQGILLHALTADDGAIYRPSISCDVRGPLDLDKLELAWQELVRRHAALRTAIVWEDVDEPVQLVLKQVDAWLDRGATCVAADADAASVIEHFELDLKAAIGDGSRAPLARLGVLRCDRDAWRLVFSFHHLVLDGWSVGILLRELFSLYALSGTSRLPAPRMTFAEFIDLHADADEESARQFWQAYLADYRGSQTWGGIVSEEAAASKIGLVEAELPDLESRALRGLLRQHQLTLGTLLQGVWALLMGYYSGESDVLFGAAVSGRSVACTGIEDLVGMCVNTVPVRARISEGESIVDFLKRLQREAAMLRDFEQTPLVSIQRWARFNPRQTPFSSLVAVENYPVDSALGQVSPELQVDNVSVSEETNYPLVLNATDAKTLLLALRHHEARVSRADAEQLLARYVRLLRAVIERPDQTPNSVVLLDERERALVLEPPRETGLERSQLVLARFNEQVRVRASEEAVSDERQRLSYGVLDADARRWAERLRAMGVGPEARVGLCMDRGVKMLSAMLGILKAGAAYVPLDPMHPPERLRFMSHDSGVEVLLTEERYASLWATAPCSLLVWEREWPILAEAAGADYSHDVDPDHLAYVIYTSGSTGRPKGSLVTHANLARLFTAAERDFVFDSQDVWTLFHSFGFDFSVWEIWGALIYGGRLVIVPEAVSRSSEAYYRLVAHERVSVLNQTPSAFLAFDQEDELRRSSLGLRYVIFGGEALEPAKLRSWIERRGDRYPELVNMYGITETTVHVTFRRISASDIGGPSFVGRPLSDLSVYVLDRRQQPLPPGIKGELYVGGAGVSRGYCDRPDLTAERFLPNPFAPGRLYRTGDLGRWTAFGDLEYFGRSDSQVKLRGFRIELREIEETLLGHPHVRNAVVVLRKDKVGTDRLHAFVVLRTPVESAELVEMLKLRLPRYMVPDSITPLDKLPLTLHGKLDIAELPEPRISKVSQDVEAPQSETEGRVYQLVNDTLGIEHASGLDNFFDLGGHSLLATQLVSRLRRSFEVEVPLRWVFEVETLAELAERVVALQPGHVEAPHLELAPASEQAPLSFAQRRLWVLHRLTQASPAYHIAGAVRLRGPLNRSALRAALEALQHRHEMLRTVFVERDGEPYQHLAAPQIELCEEDLTRMGAADIEQRCTEIVSEHAARPFDLASGPCWRVLVVQRAKEDHLLVLTMHHIVSDGWSLALLVREFGAAYRALDLGEPLPFEPISLTYASHALWTAQRHAAGAFDADLGYWRQQLEPPSSLELPLDFPRPKTRSYAGASAECALPRELAEKLMRLCERHDVTPFMLLLAALQVLLGRYSGQTDVRVGTPIANRTDLEAERLVGCFVNTLVMRLDLSGDPTLQELIEQARRVAVEAYSHQELPFEQLVDALEVDRDASRSPLFDVMFVYQNQPAAVLDLGKLGLEPYPVGTAAAKFDLTLYARPAGDGLGLAWEYSTELFRAETIERWSQAFRELLEVMASNPRKRLSELDLVTTAEREFLVSTCNETARSWPSGLPVQHQCSERALLTPDAVAVVHVDGKLSYRELEERSNRLARYLVSRGVGPERRVGLFAERGAVLVIGVLGILKAGGVYLPLEPGHPPLRLREILEDAAPSLVLVEAGRVDQWSALEPACDMQVLDGAVSCCEGFDAAALAPTVSGDHAAYVIYTSGSTGRPKGVVNTHAGLHNRLAWMQAEYPLTPDDVVMHKTPISFDVSVWELLWPFMVGATQVQAAADGHRDPAYLARTIAAEGVSVLHFVPSMLRAFVNSVRIAELTTLRRVFASGEALDRELVSQFRALSRAELVNLYGPTEAAIDVTHWRCDSVEFEPAVPIGRPIANTQMYVLDSALELLPIGCVGELYIGGIGLARGYLGRPDLSAAAWSPDPHGVAGGRLYRTGDYARVRSDGAIEYLGRKDAQVKLRGVRIELDEIAAQLRRCPGVADAAVTLQRDAQGGSLAAYWIPAAGAGVVDASSIRRELERHLPAAMLPSSFVRVSEWPRTPSGKLDVKALPVPVPLSIPTTPAQGPTEVRVLDSMRTLLPGVELGRDDSFFERGGHSLSAIQLVGRLLQSTGVELPLAAVFSQPTAAGLARLIDASSLSSQAPITRVERSGALVPSFAQERMWYLEQIEPGLPRYNVPLALRIRGVLPASRLETALGVLVRRHEILRSYYEEHAGLPRVRLREDAQMPFRVVELGGALDAEAECRRQMAEEARRGFDLRQAPPARAVLYRFSAADQALLLNLHHVAVDAWSIGNLVRELAALLAGSLEEASSNLPALEIQYADYAAWQRGRFERGELESQRQYWRGCLAGAPTLLELRKDLVNPTGDAREGRAVTFAIDASLVAAIERLSTRNGATVFMTLLAAFQTLLFRVTDQRTLLVGAPVANRTRPELEPLVGCLVNTLVLRGDLEPECSFSELLERTKTRTLEALENQEFPFDRLVDEIGPERVPDRSPLVQALFVLQTAPSGALALDGVSIEPIDVGTGMTRFDLTLTLELRADGLGGTLECRADWFGPESAARFARQFCELLRSITKSPDTRLDALALSAAHETSVLVGAAARRGTPPPVLEQWRRSVDAAPDAVAVASATLSLTRRDLDWRSNQLAHALRASGVVPDQLVAVLADRSVEFVVSILAILKAGAAFLPLDPGAPSARLLRLLELGRVPRVLCQERYARLVPANRECSVVDFVHWAFGPEPGTCPAPVVHRDNLAYATFTSGSTGEPKGVLLTRGGFANLVEQQRELFALGPADRVLQFAALTFDASVSEIFVTLTSGATLCIPGDDMLAGEALHDSLRRERITSITLPPSVVAGMDSDGLAELKTLVVAGEDCPGDVMQTWRRGRRMLNAYGPTEATVCATCAEITADTLGSTIGVPLGGARVYVLDGSFTAAASGVVGEIFIGGEGVARGYLGDPALTARCFLPDPYAATPGSRMYRTGDRARLLSEAGLEFLGRGDEQLKFHGVRIEPAEVEAAVRTASGVQNCAVVVRGQGEEARLVCFYVAAADAPAPDQLALRQAVRALLPEYMVPQRFVQIDELPRGAHGKLDRAALPALVARDEPGQYLPPATRVEAELAAIWAGVLKVERVGRYDNFFALGGDSIMSIQITARARAVGLELSPRQILTEQTLERVAASTLECEAFAPRTPPEAGTSVPLTPIQHWYFARSAEQAGRFHMAVLLELSDSASSAAIERAVRFVAREHDALRLRYQCVEGTWHQSYAGDDALALVFGSERLPSEQSAQTDLAAAVERAHQGIDAERGRVFRAVLIERGAGQTRRLLLLAHHLVIDAVSWRILLEDLAEAYAAFERGNEPASSARTVSFQTWAERLTAYAASEVVRGEIGYWARPIFERVRPLPWDVAGVNLEHTARAVIGRLPLAETRQLLARSGSGDQSRVVATLLASWLKAVSDWSGHAELAVELEGHGREELDGYLATDRTLGWFTSLFPMAFELSPGTSARAALDVVEGEFARLPQKGIGYGLLKYSKDASVRERLLQQPQVELGFEYLGQFDNVLRQAGPFALAPESAGVLREASAERPHLLELSTRVVGGELELSWGYSEAAHARTTVQALADATLRNLHELLACEPDVAALVGRLAARGRIQSVSRLSPTQEGILFHALEQPSGNVYQPCLVYSIEGELDSERLAAACRGLIARHDVLRTAFSWEMGDHPLQVVYDEVSFEVAVHDFRMLSVEASEDAIEAYQRGESRPSLDLEQAPLFRVTLFRTGERSWKLALVAHHLILDGWSLGIVLKEVFALYAGHVLPEAVQRLPFERFVKQARARQREEVLDFWRPYLAGYAPNRTLTDCLGDPDAAGNGVHKAELRLPARFTTALRERAQNGRYTLSTLLQVAWGVVVAQHSGQSDVVFGLTVSGRSNSLAGIEELVGMCANTLPARFRLSLSAQLDAVLEQVHGERIKASEYEHSPLTWIQSVSEIPPGTLLFDSILVVENYPLDASLRNPVEGLRIVSALSHELTSYPLTVAVAIGDELTIEVKADGRKFAVDVAVRLASHLVALLERMGDPACRYFAELPLVQGADSTLIDQQWPAHAQPCVHELIERQAVLRPDARAIEWDGGQMSYAELSAASNRLAHHLRERGVGPETRLGVFLERSPELVVTLLAAHKAGAAYVPLDLECPSARLEALLDGTGIELVVGAPETLAKLPATVPQLCLDQERVRIESRPAEPPELHVDPDNAAYVLFTSGSTGRPKGVTVTHRALANHVHWLGTAFELSPSEAVLLKTPIVFDASVSEVFPALAFGARLVLAEPYGHLNGKYIASMVRRHAVTVLQVVPTVLELLVDEPEFALCHTLKHVLSGGEVLRREVERKYSALLTAPLHNVYGPTETCVDATREICDPKRALGLVPLGLPVAGARCYVLGEEQQPLPRGTPGELYIAGAGLARGYLARPELTAARFLPDAVSAEPGCRMYRTGDLARVSVDGKLEFLGRIDQQLKLNGHRIEAGDIESPLKALPGVREAVVVIRERRGGHPQLIAYWTRTQDAPVVDMRARLRAVLPLYMIPSQFVELEALPLTVSGKIDRKALPDPVPESPLGRPEEPLALETDVERVLARILAEVLGVDSVAGDDNFFTLGGDSISSIQVSARARRAGLEVNPRAVLEAPTLTELARNVRAAGAAADFGPVEGEVLLTPIQHDFFARGLEHPNLFNVGVVLRLPPAVDRERLNTALRDLVNHHDALRLRFSEGASGWTASYAPAVTEDTALLEVRSLASGAPGDAPWEALVASVHASIDLESGTLFRCVLVECGEVHGERLLVVAHHVVFDGVSLRILLDDLGRAYANASASTRPLLPARTASLQLWSQHLHEYAQSDKVRSDAEYWLALEGEVLPPLPSDRAGLNTVGSTDSVRLEWSGEDTRRILKELPTAYRMGIQELLLAPFVESLLEWSGAELYLVDLEDHGRSPFGSGQPLDVSRTTGWFTVQYPVALRLQPTKDRHALLRKVKDELRRVPERGIAHGLARYLSKDGQLRERMSRVPKAQLSFEYLGQFVHGGANDTPFTPTGESAGTGRSPEDLRTHVLGVGAAVFGGRLSMSWNFSSNLHERTTIERLAERYRQSLNGMIEDLGTAHRATVATDFPELNLSTAELGRALAAVRKRKQ